MFEHVGPLPSAPRVQFTQSSVQRLQFGWFCCTGIEAGVSTAFGFASGGNGRSAAAATPAINDVRSAIVQNLYVRIFFNRPMRCKANLSQEDKKREAIDMLYGGVVVASLVLFFGIAALPPFLCGILGFSMRIPYFLVGLLTCCLIYFEVATFTNAMKYEGVLQRFLTVAETTALFVTELLVVSFVAHWIGGRCRAGVIWMKKLVFERMLIR